MFKRIGLFILTNVMVMLTISIVWSLVASVLKLQGVNNYIYLLAAMSLVVGMTGSFISLFMSKWMAKTMYGVKVIPADTMHPELKSLVTKVHELARKAKLTSMPEVGIYDSPEINAFATGPSKNNSLVAVSSGLLEKMNDSEVEGVLGHEIAHVANGDMVTMTLIQGIVNAFAFFFSRILANLIASNVEEKYRDVVYFLTAIISDIAFTLLGSIVVAYYSRQREFRADAGGARFASKEKMIGALKSLQRQFDAPVDYDDSRDAIATFKISGHKKRGSFVSLFMTHPPLSERINALERARSF